MLRMIFLLLAVTAGGGAAWLALAAESGESPAAVVVEPAPQIAMVEILVASEDIARGAALGESNLQWREWPEAAMHPAFITRQERSDAVRELAGSPTREAFVSGEPLRDDKVSGTGTNLLAGLLSAGRRAVGIRVSAESTAGGFILPGDKVDVLHTRTREDGAGGGVSRTILRNVAVLAIDQTAQGPDGESVVGKTATLDLDSRQAEILAAAEASGMISLALRSAADAGEDVETTQLETPEPRTIRVFRGMASERVGIN